VPSGATWRWEVGGRRLQKHHERQGGPDARERARRVAVPAEDGGSAQTLGLGCDHPTGEPPPHDMVEDAGRRFRTKGGRASRRGCRGMEEASHTLLYLPTSRTWAARPLCDSVRAAGHGGIRTTSRSRWQAASELMCLTITRPVALSREPGSGQPQRSVRRIRKQRPPLRLRLPRASPGDRSPQRRIERQAPSWRSWCF